MSRHILVVAGARPNFVKVAPVINALRERGMRVRFLHTGQHYDAVLSGEVMKELGLPAPDERLEVGSASHAAQTAAVVLGVEDVLVRSRPAAIVVAGDVNSTLGAAIAASKLEVPIVHLEAGLRSRDRSMPEEINRVLVDAISGLLLVHCEEAVDNLVAEGQAPESIAFVGNTMIDSLLLARRAAQAARAPVAHGVEARRYALVTLHRPSLVDDPERLGDAMEVLEELAGELPVVFPAHPRTAARLAARRSASGGQLRVVSALGYLDFIGLEDQARLVITDSGGVQEETSALGVPCLTYRTTTERAVTIDLGTNRLVGTSPAALRAALREELERPVRPAACTIPLWDGRAGPRAAEAVAAWLDR